MMTRKILRDLSGQDKSIKTKTEFNSIDALSSFRENGSEVFARKALNISDDDFKDRKLYGKWLKYFFRHEIFQDYDVLKMSLDEWLKDDRGKKRNITRSGSFGRRGKTVDIECPFGIKEAYCLKVYYDYAPQEKFYALLSSGIYVDYISGRRRRRPRKYTPPFNVCREFAAWIADDSIAYLKMLISRSSDEVREKAFGQYREIQMWLMRLEIIKLSVISWGLDHNEPPVQFSVQDNTKDCLLDMRKMVFGTKFENMTEEDWKEKKSMMTERYSKLFCKTMTKKDIQMAFNFLFEECEEEEALRKAYRFLYEYAMCSIFIFWYRLRETLKILDFAE